jgi:ABC-type uncharacterized transport system substrate-binding protein
MVPAMAFAILLGTDREARAHPHVFAEAHLEFVRDAQGAVTELRHVWRFDELFSSSVVLDYDANGDNQLDNDELDAVSKTVSESIAEFHYFTDARDGEKKLSLVAPDRILVDYQDGQILMFFSLKFAEPADLSGGQFRVAISDPTYFVALDLKDEKAVDIKGGGCTVAILRPDYDALIQQKAAELGEKFFTSTERTTLGDEWLTWVTAKCS